MCWFVELSCNFTFICCDWTLSNIYFDIYFGFDFHCKWFFLSMTSFTQILYFNFSIVLPALFIFSTRLFLSLSLFFPLSILFMQTYGFNNCDLLKSNTQFFLDLILPLKKLQVFIINHILFFTKNVRKPFFNIRTRTVIKISNL